MFCLLMMMFFQTEDTVYNLRDFRLPDVGAMKLEIGAHISGSERRRLADDSAYSYRSSSGDLGGGGGIKWDLVFSGEKRFFDVTISSYLSGHWDSYKVEARTDTLDSTKTSSGYSIHGYYDLGSDGGWYIKESPWFLGWDTDLDLRQWVYYSDVYYYDEPVKGNELDLDGVIFLGGGIGKIRGVSSAVHAWEFLDELGVANRENIEALAQVLATRWAYELKYWRYEKYFYSDVEEALVEIGAVPRLSAYQVMRLDEIINNLTGWRTSGIRCFVGLGGMFSGFDSIPFHPGVRLNILAGYPISRRWQTSVYSEGTAYYLYLDNLTFQGTCGGSVYYYLGERWRIGSSVMSKIYYLWMEEEDFWAEVWVTPFSLSYYLDEKLTIDAFINYGLDIYRHEAYSSSWHDVSIDFDLTWRLR